MNKTIKYLFSAPNPVDIALLEVNVDPAAERLLVIDRRSGERMCLMRRSPSGVNKAILPKDFALSGIALLGLLDDDREYNAKFKDGVTCELVDQRTVNLSQ